MNIYLYNMNYGNISVESKNRTCQADRNEVAYGGTAKQGEAEQEGTPTGHST